MFKIYIILILNLVTSIYVSHGHTKRHWSVDFKIRCTRRYSPGTCLEPVEPMWTYNYQLQNCTERLGCWQTHRSNRFKSYRRCMRRCRTLSDLYFQILSFGESNDTDLFYLRTSAELGNIGRRESGDTEDPMDTDSTDDEYPEPRDKSNDDAIINNGRVFIDTLYDDAPEDAIGVADIDKVRHRDHGDDENEENDTKNNDDTDDKEMNLNEYED